MTEIFFSYSSIRFVLFHRLRNAHRHQQQQHWEFSRNFAITQFSCINKIFHECITIRGEKILDVSFWPNADKNPRRIDFPPSVCLHFGWVIALAAGNMSFHNFYIFMVIWLCVNIRARKKEKKTTHDGEQFGWKKLIYLSVKMWKFWALSVLRCGFRAASTINRGNRMQFTLNGNGAIDWWFRTLARRFAMPLDCDLRKINNGWKAELRIIKKMQLAKSLSTVDQEWIWECEMTLAMIVR